jgi:hypothetical protein
LARELEKCLEAGESPEEPAELTQLALALRREIWR